MIIIKTKKFNGPDALEQFFDQQIETAHKCYYVTGFTEADGCFHFACEKIKKNSDAIRFIPIFYITQDKKARHILKYIHHYLGEPTARFVSRKQDNTTT